MKKLKFAILTCTTVAVLAACSTPAPTSFIGFNYEIDNGRATSIVQVFDLSGSTVVHIRDLNRKTTRFVDTKSVQIPFKIVGENVVLAGMYSDFTVSTAVATSHVLRKSSAPTIAPLASAGVPTVEHLAGAGAPTSPPQPQVSGEPDAAIVAEISRMRKELVELKAILAAAASGETKMGAQSSPVIAAELNNSAEPSVVIVSFPNNGGDFNPPQEQRTQLQALSHASVSISVRGFTDSEFATPGSIALAKARAESAKRYLMSMGISATKIVIGFDGAGKFIAENRSASGRAANRRVEIGGA